MVSFPLKGTCVGLDENQWHIFDGCAGSTSELLKHHNVVRKHIPKLVSLFPTFADSHRWVSDAITTHTHTVALGKFHGHQIHPTWPKSNRTSMDCQDPQKMIQVDGNLVKIKSYVQHGECNPLCSTMPWSLKTRPIWIRIQSVTQKRIICQRRLSPRPFEAPWQLRMPGPVEVEHSSPDQGQGKSSMLL